MSITDILENTNARNITISIGINDLRRWYLELVNDKISQMEKEAAEKAANELMTTEDVCDFLGRSSSTLQRWKKRGYLVPARIGGRLMYRRIDVEKILGTRKK